MRPTPSLPVTEYAERSDPGRDPDKQVNEDACMHRETSLGHLCVVCDGMGGHAAGREAAELAIETIAHAFDYAVDDDAPTDKLRAAIAEANRAVFAMRTSEIAMGRPGCTVVAILMHAQGTEVAHVGDSRAYLVHEGQLSRVTRDHSIVQELVDRGLISLQQAARHPDANRITRALGMAPEVEAEVRPQPVPHVAGDSFILCSDGLSDLVEDEEMLSIVGSDPPAQAVSKLVDLANARGGHDNITVLVLRARESAAASAPSLARTVAETEASDIEQMVSSPAEPHQLGLGVPPHLDGPLESSVGVAASERPLEPTPAPDAPSLPPAASTRNPIVIAGLALAFVAAGLLGLVLAWHLRERSGKRTSSGIATLPAAAAPDGGLAAASFDAETVVLTPASSLAVDPIAPLEPAVPKSKKHKR
jgi:protein phosphatase